MLTLEQAVQLRQMQLNGHYIEPHLLEEAIMVIQFQGASTPAPRPPGKKSANRPDRRKPEADDAVEE